MSVEDLRKKQGFHTMFICKEEPQGIIEKSTDFSLAKTKIQFSWPETDF
jgi:hypothetical protein